MTEDTWRAAQELFDLLVETPTDRQRLLDEQCSGRPDVRQAVSKLLAADQRTRVWFDAMPVTALHEAIQDELAEHWIGRSLGAYRILEKIGQGGMGQVFLAEREDDVFDKRVAVKIMSATSPAALERFHLERQILADLDHPGIARLLDGGTTQDGLPYVVMEHVDGLPLDGYCAAQGADLETRLRLFLEICAAVQYAHRNLIVHRDLKPGNVLVAADGRAKLLDFGIAKLLESPETEAQQTVAAERVLTPDYASPEQIAGAAVTTASDVYSLGVMLYEMLTGRRPFRRGGAALTTPSAGPPELPSSVAARARKPGDGGAEPLPARALRGDLDNIVLKALRQDPAERYPSVESLAADLRNYRAGMPVEARAPSFAYRTRKFFGRHPLATVLSTAALLLLIGFSAVTLVQSRRLKAERDLARQSLGFMVNAFKSADPQENLGRELTAQDILQRGAERLGTDSELPDALQEVLMLTLGQVQVSLGENEKGRDWLRRSVEVGERLYGADDPRLGRSLMELAEALLFTAEYQEAEETAVRALELIPETEPAQRIRVLHARAEAVAGLGRWEESATLHEGALALARRTLPSNDVQLFDSLFATARRVWSIRGGDLPRQWVDEGLEFQRRNRPGDRGETARLLVFSGRLHLGARDLEAARGDLERGLAMKLRVYGAEHPTVAVSYERIAQLERRAGSVQRAAEYYEKALAIFAASLDGAHPLAVGARRNFAKLVHRDLADPERAAPIFLRALTDFESVEGSENSPNTGYLLLDYGAVLNELGRFAEAEPIWRRARDLWLRLQEDESGVGLRSRLGLAEAHEGQGDLQAALRELEECWRVAGETRDLEDPVMRQAGEALAALYHRTGRLAEASEVEMALARATPKES